MEEYLYELPKGYGVVQLKERDGFLTHLSFIQETVEVQENKSVVPKVIQQTIIELDEYIIGKRTEFDIPITFSHVSKFEEQVYQSLLKIEYGQSTTYKEISIRTFTNNHTRAVANAIGRNPICIIVPCHRVLYSNGRLGGYSGGIHKKINLLNIEHIQFKPNN